MKILLIDDEEMSLDFNEIMLKELGGVEVVGKFTNPYFALERLEVMDVDVVFLDMEMGAVNGLELAGIIRSKYSHIEIMFVTAHAQYALKAFEVNAVDYLLKPLNKKRLKRAIERIKEKLDLYKESKKQLAFKEANFYMKTFGGFHLLDNQQNIVKWRTKKVKELFLFLWQHNGAPIHKAVVMEQLWPEIHAEKAAKLLHTTVYQLRKTFKEQGIEDAVQFNNDHYSLGLLIDSDCTVLEGLLKDNEMESSEVEQILTLYKGDFLEEADFRWVTPIQQRLRQSVLQYLEQIISVGEVNPLLIEECLLKMLELDCYNETYMYNLLAFYENMENSQKMKEFYKMIEARLGDDLGIEVPIKIKKSYGHFVE